MIPTRLAKLPNSTGFLISIASGKWYLGESLPGDVSSFTDAMWVYGQYHICVVQLTDGHYHVYQSKDNGYSWNDVLDFGSEKYGCMICPNYGRAIICTSAGWWASDNSGTSWSKISTQASGCFCVKEITSDILIALDGTYVWRSVDGGATWAQAKCATTGTWVGSQWNPIPTNIVLKAYTNYPSIDGTYYDIILGVTSSNCDNYDWLNSVHGHVVADIYADSSNRSRLLYSTDGGQYFTHVPAQSSWNLREYCQVNPSWNLGSYPTMPREVKCDVITDIEMAHIKPDGLPIFVVQVLMQNGNLRHYYLERLGYDAVRAVNLVNPNVAYAGDGYAYWTTFKCVAKFDAIQSQADSLTSEEYMIPGTSNVSGSVTFCGKTIYDTPLMNVSRDFGWTWLPEDIANASIYTGPDLSQLSSGQNPFTEDTYLTASFSHGPCHNCWEVLGSRYRRFLSFDSDILFRERVFNLGYPGGFTSILSQVKSFGADYITQKILTKSAPLDLVSKKAMLSAFVGKYISRDTFDSSVDDDLVIVTRRYCGLDYDILAQKAFNAQLGHRAYVRGTLEHGTGSNIVLAQTHFPEIYVEMERGFPQQWDIPSLGRESKLSYKRGVMDTTRTEEE